MFALVASSQTIDKPGPAAEGALSKAKRAFDAQRYAEAAQLFEAARQREPACEISFYLGLTRYRLHEVDAALVAFQEATKCNPKLTLAYIALGEAYAERGNEGEALAAYERALSLDPENEFALRSAAALYLRGRRNEKAVAALEVLVKVAPTDSQAHADLGAAYFGTSNQEAA
jgi:tetratricopeptide (TPR) repeat protein